MAASNPPGHSRPDDEDGDRPPVPIDSFGIDSPSKTLQAMAFWSAIILPFLHVPLLSTGLTSPSEAHAFVVLLALNTVALYAGHPHGRE